MLVFYMSLLKDSLGLHFKKDARFMHMLSLEFHSCTYSGHQRVQNMITATYSINSPRFGEVATILINSDN